MRTSSASSGDVRGVDDPRVGLAARDLGEHPAHVLLVGHHVGERRVADPGAAEGLARVGADRHGLAGEHQAQAGPRKVGRPLDRRIAGGRDDHQAVPGEHPRRLQAARGGRALHLRPVGRGEHVGRRAGDDLRRQDLRAREVEDDVEPRVLGLEAGLEVGEGFLQGHGRRDM
ncbi:hypothetical protein OV079_43300 [Nannocystis pusilla]|uniref:Uncharacterized protein n=1 Tax=Nannocystis pusilla TaxID=889268 RepID=A0A9X3J2K6_9BACT|nr:hypothetical protein [Nannocystis pusilla]MCY1012250.1 hypothetical protein [Nannocystis pusilla]